MTGRRAALFRNGRNQAVRIPRDLEMEGTEVRIAIRATASFQRVPGLAVEDWPPL